jgi:hypothetical protein
MRRLPAAVHAREIVLIEQDIVVRGLAEYPLMATQIKVPLDGARHDSVDDSPRRTFRLRGGWPPSATEASGKRRICALCRQR